MADEIDTAQEALLTLKAKGSGKPVYFDASQNQPIAIGDELEAFCILLDPALREDLIERLSISDTGDPDRQAIYIEALRKDETDMNLLLPSFDSAIDGFGAFRDQVLQSPFGTSTQVAPLIQDLQRGVGSVGEMRDRTYHALQIARVLKLLNGREAGSEAQQAQRASWEPVLSLYR
jgi:hypothetical protein